MAVDSQDFALFPLTGDHSDAVERAKGSMSANYRPANAAELRCFCCSERGQLLLLIKDIVLVSAEEWDGNGAMVAGARLQDGRKKFIPICKRLFWTKFSFLVGVRNK